MNLWKMDSRIGYWEVLKRLGAGSRCWRLTLGSVTESCHAWPSMAIAGLSRPAVTLLSHERSVPGGLCPEIQKPQKQTAWETAFGPVPFTASASASALALCVDWSQSMGQVTELFLDK